MAISDWQLYAACSGIDQEVFFPTNMSPYRFNHAKTICETCPVIAECLDFALTFEDNNDQWGVFGGRTPKERSNIRYLRDRKISKKF